MKKKIFITSALPYVNNVPHLGNIIGCVLSGDIYARYKRQNSDNDVIYLCGTDEYGSTTTIKAKQEGLSCREICDKYHKLHKEIYDWFNIEFDIWGRTTTDEQTEITHEIFLNLYKNGHIEEREIVQKYCDKCQIFLADRYIKGICYHNECLKLNNIANGDQCDFCQKIIDINLLIKPFCYLCGTTPINKKSNHLFLKLSGLTNEITNYLNQNTMLKPQAMSIAKSWLKSGLTSRCITRDLEWGTPIPKGIDTILDQYKNKVFYVWFDAPFGYYSILAKFKTNWREWLSDDVNWVSTQAKDNIPFHTIIFPASVLGSNIKFPLIQQICSTDYLLYEGKKFSKSKSIGLFGDQVIKLSNELGINEDYWRFYLTKIRPENHDSSFNMSEFVSTIKADLINNIGNFINRCYSLTNKFNFNKQIQTKYVKTPIDELETYTNKYDNLMNNFKFADAIRLCLELSSFGNQYIQTEKPWTLMKSNNEKMVNIIGRCNQICHTLIGMLYPFIPRTVTKFRRAIEIHDENDIFTFTYLNNPGLLFKEIKLENIEKILNQKEQK